MNEQKRVMPEQPLRLIFDNRALHLEFVDLFQATATPEFLLLSAIQRFPESENLSEGVSPEQLPPSGRMLSRFVITWPHAVRLRDLLDRLIQQYKSQATTIISTASGGEKNELANKND